MVAASRTIAEPKLSPRGDRVAFISSGGGRPSALTLVSVHGGPEVVVTSDPAPMGVHAYGGGTFDWCPDGDALVFVSREGSLWWVAADGGPPLCLTAQHPIEGQAASPTVSPDGASVAYTIDQEVVAVVPTDAGAWPRAVSPLGEAAADFVMNPTWSADSAFVGWHQWSVPHMPWDESQWVVAPADGTGAPIVFGSPGVAVSQPRFAPHGSDLAFLSDATGWLNLWVFGSGHDNEHPLVAEAFEHGSPQWGPGMREFAWSPDATRIAFTRNESGFARLAIVDVATGAVSDVARAWHVGISWVGDRLAAVRTGGVTPGQLVVYDTRDWSRVTVARGPVAGIEAMLNEPEPVIFPADDGSTLHGRLYQPQSEVRHGGLLLWIHGGPTDQAKIQFNARFAFYLARGWTILVPDHRGSTGHGRAYTMAMRGRWGELDTLDNAAALRAAVSNGWGNAHQLVPIGGSAGGYAVLHLLAAAPDLCAAGVDLFGVADLLELDETTHRFEKHYLHTMIGPLPEAVQKYRDLSPVNHVDAIRSPLLILQGGADNVVPLAQSQAIHDRLRSLGRTVELQVYDGQGHGWNDPKVIHDELDRTDDFLRRHVLRWRHSDD